MSIQKAGCAVTGHCGIDLLIGARNSCIVKVANVLAEAIAAQRTD
ncbi:MAG: hypothetical protein ACJAVR_000932 [Paracoccaceae bacterium]